MSLLQTLRRPAIAPRGVSGAGSKGQPVLKRQRSGLRSWTFVTGLKPFLFLKSRCPSSLCSKGATITELQCGRSVYA